MGRGRRVGHRQHRGRAAASHEKRNCGRGGLEVVGDDLRGHEEELQRVGRHHERHGVVVVLGGEKRHR